MREVDIAIIGGGAAGMAAAVAAYKQGARSILILERNDSLGGVLRQCIHNGFGLHRFQEDLTGVEFAARYAREVERLQIPYLLRTFVIELGPDRVIKAVHPQEGLLEIHAGAIVLAMGCRERSRNALLIPGTRGAGIMTAGTAQKYLNIDGYLPGRRVVILGSGDIGLIMARQFILEGASVEAVVEIQPYSSGLPRNMKQCIEDFGIPVYYQSTISRIKGKERVSSVCVASVDSQRQVIPSTEFEIPCDTLLISAGLIPENELTEMAGVPLSDQTRGAVVTEDYQTGIEGIFACGNALHVHDLVDFVAEEAERAGQQAARFLQGTAAKGQGQGSLDACIPVTGDSRVRGLVPQFIHRPAAAPDAAGEGAGSDDIILMFRPADKMKDAQVSAWAAGAGGSGSDQRRLASRRFRAITPGEMIRLDLKAQDLAGAARIEIRLEEVQR